MKCIHCGSEWTPAKNLRSNLENCPFCGGRLAPERKEFTTFQEVLIAYRDSYGVESLRNGPGLRGYVADMAPQMQKERRVLGYFVECSGPQKLMDSRALTATAQHAAMEKLVIQMTEEMLIAESAVRMICDAFWQAAAGEPTKTVEPPVKNRRKTPPQPRPPKPKPAPIPEDPSAIPPMPEGMPMEWYGAATGQMDAGYIRQILKHCEKNFHLERYRLTYYIMARRLEEQKEPLGIYAVGLCHRDGIGTARNLEKSEACFHQAKRMGDPKVAKLADQALAEIDHNDPEKFVIENGTLLYYLGHCRHLRIPDGVRYIGTSAFREMNFLESVELPQGVEWIDDLAFFGCTALQAVKLPKSLKRIGYCAFQECRSLKEIQLPENLMIMESGAFRYCESLEEVTIPGGVQAVESFAFFGCRGLKQVLVEDGVDAIGDGAFENCSALVSVSIFSDISQMGFGVFSGCTSLKRVLASQAWKHKFRDKIPKNV